MNSCCAAVLLQCVRNASAAFRTSKDDTSYLLRILPESESYWVLRCSESALSACWSCCTSCLDSIQHCLFGPAARWNQCLASKMNIFKSDPQIKCLRTVHFVQTRDFLWLSILICLEKVSMQQSPPVKKPGSGNSLLNCSKRWLNSSWNPVL